MSRETLEFDKQLYQIKVPVSQSRIQSLTKLALKNIKVFMLQLPNVNFNSRYIFAQLYKNVVYSIEKFIQKCAADSKLPGLYVINAIATAAKKHPEGEVYLIRFEEKLESLIPHLLQASSKDKEKMKKVITLWKQGEIFDKHFLDKLLNDHFQNVADVTAVAPSSAPVLANASSTDPRLNDNGIPDSAQAIAADPNLINTLTTLNQLNQLQQLADLTGISNNNGLVGLLPLLQPQNPQPAQNDLNILTSILGLSGQNPVNDLNFNAQPAIPHDDFNYDDDDSSHINPNNQASYINQPINQTVNQENAANQLLNMTAAAALSRALGLPNPTPWQTEQTPVVNVASPPVASPIKTQSRWGPGGDATEDKESSRGYGNRSRQNSDRDPRIKNNQQTEDDKPGPECEKPTHDPTVPPDAMREFDLTVKSRTIYVGNVSTNVTCQQIRELFETGGRVATVIINYPKYNAFVKMFTRAEAEKVKELVNRSTIGDSQLKLSWGCGFGPKQTFNYSDGDVVYRFADMSDSDKRCMVSSRRGGGPLEGSTVVEEPDIPSVKTGDQAFGYDAAVQALMDGTGGPRVAAGRGDGRGRGRGGFNPVNRSNSTASNAQSTYVTGEVLPYRPRSESFENSASGQDNSFGGNEHEHRSFRGSPRGRGRGRGRGGFGRGSFNNRDDYYSQEQSHNQRNESSSSYGGMTNPSIYAQNYGNGFSQPEYQTGADYGQFAQSGQFSTVYQPQYNNEHEQQHQQQHVYSEYAVNMSTEQNSDETDSYPLHPSRMSLIEQGMKRPSGNIDEQEAVKVSETPKKRKSRWD
ncbi:hypothetical protein HK098_006180 [Nowakowskiella sp. JEL0407]|nr:hypothetical protein HK098_006180 [Nowakowskiella sp. JEL0407]